jgi:hypothetical protein
MWQDMVKDFRDLCLGEYDCNCSDCGNGVTVA